MFFYATNTLSRFAMASREGYMKATIWILFYLNSFPKRRILFDTVYPTFNDINDSDNKDWTEFYSDTEKELLPDIPPPKIFLSELLFMWIQIMSMI